MWCKPELLLSPEANVLAQHTASTVRHTVLFICSSSCVLPWRMGSHSTGCVSVKTGCLFTVKSAHEGSTCTRVGVFILHIHSMLFCMCECEWSLGQSELILALRVTPFWPIRGENISCSQQLLKIGYSSIFVSVMMVSKSVLYWWGADEKRVYERETTCANSSVCSWSEWIMGCGDVNRERGVACSSGLKVRPVFLVLMLPSGAA